MATKKSPKKAEKKAEKKPEKKPAKEKAAKKPTKKAEKVEKKVSAKKAEKPEKAEKAEKKPVKEKAAKAAAPVKPIKPQTKSRALAPRARGKVQEYQPDQQYSVGDVIYHPVWGSEGKVVEVGKTADGLEKMMVDFGRGGVKKLVMAYSVHF